MITILVAMKEELSGIVSESDIETAISMAYPSPNATFPFPHIVDNRRNAVFVLTGIGRANAAAAAQWAIDAFKPDSIINFGTGGSLSDDVPPGSVVVATSCVSSDFDISAFGHLKGYVEGLGRRIFCDRRLADLAISILIENNIRFRWGTIATNDAFINDADAAKEIAEEFDSIACDMEAAGIAQIARRNNVPFLPLKKISDSADEDAGKAFEELENEKADIASQARFVVEEMLARLAPASSKK